MDKTKYYDFIPGFTMGIVRAIISHPFEILKLKTQINSNNNYKNLFTGLHYSIISNSIERGIQFGLYEKLRKDNNNIISSFKSSLISTSISLPYNIILLRKNIMNSNIKISKNIFIKSLLLEYSRNLSGSILFLYSYNLSKDNNYPIFIRAPFASSIVWLFTYPLDSYKNKLIANVPIKYHELYRGIQYPILRSIPSSIIGFYVYEYMLNYIKKI
jgi:hypothetical protein